MEQLWRTLLSFLCAVFITTTFLSDIELSDAHIFFNFFTPFKKTTNLLSGYSKFIGVVEGTNYIHVAIVEFIAN